MFEFNATMIVAMFSFIVFMFLMDAIFYKPVLNIIKKRESYINSNYNRSQELDKQAQDCEDEHTEKLAAAKDNSSRQTAVVLDKLQKETFSKTQMEKEKVKASVSNQKTVLSQKGIELQNTLNNNSVAQFASLITSKILKRGE